MKKRVLSMFMALALCLTLLPAPAWAAEADAPEGGAIVQEEQQEKAPAEETDTPEGGETTAEAVAKVAMTASDGATWSKEYTDLLEAFDAARMGRWTEDNTTVDADTVSVELLKHGEIYTLGANEAFSISFGYSHSVIIDLNGCTLKRTVSETQQGILEVRDSGNVTLKNGTLELDDSESLNPAQAIDMPINGGNPTLTLENMTITVADIPENSSRDDQGYAINAKGGTLDLQGDTLLDGGLTMTGDARLKNKLTAGRFTHSGSATFSVSVVNSKHYKTVFDLLATGYVFAEYNDGSTGAVISKDTITAEMTCDSVVVIKCTHTDENSESLLKNGTCTRCGLTCAHERVENGVCTVCKQEMKAQDNTGKYYLNLQDTFAGVADGGTVTMLKSLTSDNMISFCKDTNKEPVDKTVTLMMNGNSLSFEGAPTLYVESGKLIIGDEAKILQTGTTAQPAVFVDNNDRSKDRGTLEFKGKATLTGGLFFQNYGKLEGGLKEGTTITSNGTYSVSVKNSATYSNVLELLGDGLAFAKKEDSNVLVNGNVKELTEDVVVVKHKHNPKCTQNPDPGAFQTYLYICDCGFVCPHDKFTNSICDICHAACTHDEYDGDGKCARCGAQSAVLVEYKDNVGIVTPTRYMMTTDQNGNDVTLQKVFHEATDGSTVTLLEDGLRASGAVTGKTITLNLNGKTIDSGNIKVGRDQDGMAYISTLKITGSGSIAGNISVGAKGMLDLSGWTGGTISTVGLSKNGTDESVLHVGENAGTIGRLEILNWPTDANDTTYINNTELRGGSYNQILITIKSGTGADKTIPYSNMLAEDYAFQYVDSKEFVDYAAAAQYSNGGSISNVKVVKCPHDKINEDSRCAYCNKTGIKATVGGTTYDDVSKAVEDWLANGGTLKLYDDYTATNGTWSIGSGSHTINLNGHRMSVRGDGAFKPTNNMHLTVTDDTERGQIENILLDGSQVTLESGYVGNLEMTGGAVVALKGGSVDNLDVQNSSANTKLSIQGGSLGELNIKDWADGMHVSATSGSLGAYTLPSGKILADVLDHQYYSTGTSLDKWIDTAQPVEKFVIKQAPYDFESTSKAAAVPINGSIPFTVDPPSGNVGVYEVKWYRRTDSGAEHMTENKVAGVNVGDTLDVFCVITGVDRPNNGTVLWQVAVKDYTIKVVPADLSQGAVVFKQVGESTTGLNLMGNIKDGKGTFVFAPWGGNVNNASTLTYCFEVSHDGQKLIEGKDYTIESGNTAQYAGDHTLTIQGKGNYTGTATHQWEIKPYQLTRGNYRPPTITKVYDGTTGFDFSNAGWGIFTENVDNRPNDAKSGKNPALGADGTAISIYLKPDDFEASAVTLDSPDAGDRTASYTITLKTRDGQTKPNFAFEDGGSPTIQVTAPAYITKAFLSSSPEAGKLNVANNHPATYTVDLKALLPTLESPKEYGKVTYELGAVSINGGYYDAAKGSAEVKDGKLILPIQAVKTDTTGSIGSVQVKVSTTNYIDFTLTINVNATNKIVPTGEPTLSTKTLTYGQALSAIKLSGKLHDNVNNKDVEGTFTWADGTVKPSAGSYEAAWKFTPADGDTYTEADGTVTITVNQAKPTGEPIYTRITAANKTLKDAALKPNTSWPTGTIQWVDKEGKVLPDTTEVKANTAYKWIFTPTGADAANYTKATGELTLYSVSTGGGGGGSSSGSSDNNPIIKTETKNNPDGSTTKTETKKDGTVIETTTGKDGSVSKTETKPDGSSVTENKAADGSTGTVKTDKHGQTTAETALSSKAIEDAKRNGEPVKAPVKVKASRNSNTAPTVKVELPKGTGETKVEIPVSNMKPGTVAVLVHPDGTEEIVKNSLPTEDGIQLTVNGGATVKIVDNSKDFIDTRSHWAKDAIDFVSARGLVNGMNDSIYAPNNSTTRAQLWTILARQNDADLNGGNTWYEKAQLWSKNKGISDGTEPNAAINRAQMVTMLWRTMGQPTAGGTANFTDVPADSYYASAVAWAVENGITDGVGGGHFDPNSTCTRAQIATFLWRAMAE